MTVALMQIVILKL